jgi:hypothetical protein
MAYNFQTGKSKIKLLMEYENVMEKVLFISTVLAALMSGRKKLTSYLKMATVQKKTIYVLWFFETKSVIKTQRLYRTQYRKDPPLDNAI